MKIKIFVIKTLFILGMMSGTHVYAASKDSLLSDWDQRRVVAWRDLISGNQNKSNLDKISSVNTFVNQIQYVEDIQEWGKKDYWATPSEFIKRNAGDCEDFAIAKYFTLIEMGIPESQLRIAYVYSKKMKQAHMVLYYYPAQGKQALVLDNLSEKIQPASDRQDLMPVYSFNKKGLWLINKGGSTRFVGSSKRLSLWQDMLKRRPLGALASL